MRVEKSQFLSMERLAEQVGQSAEKSHLAYRKSGISFQDVLQQKTNLAQSGDLQNIRFSKHAMNRLSDRNITLTQEQMTRLSEGAQKAGTKGIRESLVIMDQLAFIVNIPNNTVITAMDQTETNENVFTNIDGAVII